MCTLRGEEEEEEERGEKTLVGSTGKKITNPELFGFSNTAESRYKISVGKHLIVNGIQV